MKRKLLFSIITSIICHSLLGQSFLYSKEKIDSIVGKTDSIFSKQSKSFNVKKYLTEGKPYTEQWSYLKDLKYLLCFKISYTKDSTRYEEKYYLDKGALVYTTETEVSYFPSFNPPDSIGWGAFLYFSKGKLIYEWSLGHGKSEIDSWDSEKETLVRYSKRRYKRPELSSGSK